METTRTSTVVVSSTHSAAAARRTPRRLSKVALLRIKIATVIAAVALFVGSMVGVATYNPRTANRAAVPVQAPQPQIQIVTPSGSQPLVVPAPNFNNIQPLTRSRGS